MFKYGPKQGKKHNNKDATCPWHRWQGTSRGSVCVCLCVLLTNWVGHGLKKNKKTLKTAYGP